MSGHNKWSKIKHKKAAADAQKSKVFSKLARLITMESKKANGDKNSPGLRMIIEKAKKENMPNDNIERAIKKGLGGDATEMESVLYEAYGPGGCGLVIEGLTDNKNRTGAEVKHILSKRGFSLAGMGAVTWAFEKTADEWSPNSTITLTDQDGETLGGLIDELEDNDDIQNVYTNAV